MGSSDVGSSHSINHPSEGIMIKYLRYKEMCAELAEENIALKREKLDFKRKYEAECFNVADLESYNHQLWIAYSKLNSALEEQKKAFDSNMKALQDAADGMHEKLLETNRSLNLSVELKTVPEQKCGSWWCPKHSDLATAHKSIEMISLKDKIEIELALGRQKLWCKDNEIRCCVYDRKTEAVDRYTKPPDSWVQYKKKQKLVGEVATANQPGSKDGSQGPRS